MSTVTPYLGEHNRSIWSTNLLSHFAYWQSAPSFHFSAVPFNKRGPGSSVGIANDYGLDGPEIESRLGEIFRTCQDQPWGPPSLLYNGYWVFGWGKIRQGRAADHSPPSSAVVMEG